MAAWLSMLVVVAFAQVSAAAPSAGELQIEASIRAQNDIPIPAEVEGVLSSLPVRDGARVEAGQVLATIDDRQARAAVEVAQYTLEAAQERAKDNIEQVYAEAAAAVAKVDLQKALLANQGVANAVTEIDVLKKRLDHRRATLQIEKAGKDMVIAAKEAAVKEAELRAAKIALDRRTIAAPFDGNVQELFLHEAEWVNPGDPIMRLVQFDVMLVEGYVDSAEYKPSDLDSRPVSVVVQLASGQEATVEGRITYINQTVLDDGEFLVRAEIQNSRNGNYWLIRPGLPALMTIHVNRPPTSAPQVTAAGTP